MPGLLSWGIGLGTKVVKCQRSGHLLAGCSSCSLGGQGQLGGPAAAAALSPVQKRELGLFAIPGFACTMVADVGMVLLAAGAVISCRARAKS